ncbi:MAG: hypothetical protein RLZZ414_1062 [Bacteroidota bacterium]|jgi:homoserine dehydrogenase
MALRKPKAKKLPKKPRAGASIEVMKNYLKKHSDVVKANKDALSKYEKDKKERAALKQKISGLKR